MVYYENSFGIFCASAVPDGAVELTAEEYAARLNEIREKAAENPPEDVTIDPEEIDIEDAEALEIITGGGS